ncbi:mRNA deadenylase subunit [Trachipleistophora hominis]|uniref:poly(A)-specific ribonuclease n=1 Tax=Trachipleistophora hominis TaxID=72359 RepID=L7JXI9_TRAHO|nr:mRNA deadenylase subunit [Trachipleistophora hominis]
MDNNIIEVWSDNLESSFSEIRKLVQTYNYVTMDTEFPGVVAKPLGNFTSHSTYAYQQLRCNVDLLKVIQVGITFSDCYGNCPARNTYQFNFHFDIDKEMYAKDSLKLLVEAQLNFDKHRLQGIEVEEFGNLLITSGLILSKNVTWLSFHSSYDFAYLMKIVTCNPLPATENEFFMFMNILFPNFYDVKYLLRGSKYLKRGLQEIAEDLGLKRVGVQHQAGSDALLTRDVFFKVKEIFYTKEDITRHAVKLYGIECRADEEKVMVCDLSL